MSFGTSNTSQPAFTGNLLFVNTQSNKNNRSVRKSEILSHVQRNYRRWQRKQKIIHLRESAFMNSRYLQIISSSTLQENPTPFLDRGCLSLSPINRNPHLGHGNLAFSHKPLATLLLPPIAVYGGNSDPFGVYAIDIDPKVNSLIAFYRDCVIPAQYHVPASTWVSSANARSDWSICISSLSDKGTADAFIGRSATVAAVLNPVLQSDAIKFRTRSIQSLRTKLEEGNITYDENIITQIVMLQKAEIVVKNLSAAVAHAKILQHLFQVGHKSRSTINFTLLQYALWSDSQISTYFMTPQVFDVSINGWVVESLHPVWSAALEHLAAIPQWRTISNHVADHLDPCVEIDELRPFFVSRRTTLQTWLIFGFSGLPMPPSVMLWLATTASVQQGRMIQYCLHAAYQVTECSESLRSYWHAQQYLIISEFLWTHQWSYKVEVCGVDLFNVVPILLGRLRAALGYDGLLLHDQQHPKYQNARLWALFIGAFTERKQQSENVNEYWFRLRFVNQVRQMDLSIWESVYYILQGFNYADIVRPCGSELFHELMFTL